MKDEDKTKKQLTNELAQLRKRIIILESMKVDSKQVKETIHIANERLEYLLFSTATVIYTAKASDDYTTTFISTNVPQIVGYEARDFLEKSNFWIDHIHPEDVQRVLDELPRIFEKEFYTYEYRFKRKDGTYIWIRDEMKLVRNEKGEPLEIVGYWVDITGLKKIEEELKRAKNHLDNIIESSLDGIVVSDSMGYVTRVNTAFLKLIDFEEEEVIGKHIAEFTPYEDGTYEATTGEMVEIDEKFIADAAEMAGNKLFENGRVANWHSYYLRKDGKIVPVENNVAYLYNEQGQVFGAIGLSRDITKRRHAENALRVVYQELEEKIKERTAKLETANQELSRAITNHLQTEETLRKSEEKYQGLIEHANDTIISINREGIIIGFNKKAEEMFGYSREEILGKPATSLAPPPQIEKQRKMLKKFKKGELLDIDKKVTEGKGLKKNGQVFSSEFSYYVLDLYGEYIATAIIRDISERKE
ncbi:MAG: PAS domain S-box protein, partial [Thermodesulfobacteriota bacterium]